MNNVLIIGIDPVEIPIAIASIKASIKDTFASEIESNYIKRIIHPKRKSYFYFQQKT
jgi:hypothetical protein